MGNSLTAGSSNSLATTFGRKFILFFDGTGNCGETDKLKTNIWYMYQEFNSKVSLDDSLSSHVILHYIQGIGTRQTENEIDLNLLLDKISAPSINYKIIKAFKFLVDLKFRETDELYLFGFSRGAFTALSLSNFIRFAGIPFFTDLVEITNIFERYKQRNLDNNEDQSVINWLCRRVTTKDNIQLKFIGLFDIVHGLKSFDFRNHDTTIDCNFHKRTVHLHTSDHSKHFTSLELRHTCNNGCECYTRHRCDGDHCNVGGGWPSGPNCNGIGYKRLSNHTLRLMATYARNAGVNFMPDFTNVDQNGNLLYEILDNTDDIEEYTYSVQKYEHMALFDMPGLLKYIVYNTNSSIFLAPNHSMDNYFNVMSRAVPNDYEFPKCKAFVLFGELTEEQVVKTKIDISNHYVNCNDILVYRGEDSFIILKTHLSDLENGNLDHFNCLSPDKINSVYLHAKVLSKLLDISEHFSNIHLSTNNLIFLVDQLFKGSELYNKSDIEKLNKIELFNVIANNDFTNRCINDETLKVLINGNVENDRLDLNDLTHLSESQENKTILSEGESKHIQSLQLELLQENYIAYTTSKNSSHTQKILKQL